MGHEHKGGYSAKHGSIRAEDRIVKAIDNHIKDKKITCAAAHKAAQEAAASPEIVGQQIDLLEYKITHCQVGLFGYPETGKNFDNNIIIGDALDKAIEELKTENAVTCSDCWEIARQLKLKRLEVGSACEKKGVRIKPCQLGTF